MNDPNFISHESSYTVAEFCAAERISRVSLYQMWKLGHGPRFYPERKMSPHHTRGQGSRWQRAMEDRATMIYLDNVRVRGGGAHE